MTAVHLAASGLASDWTAVTVETTLKRLAGVAKFVVVRSLGLVSVLFDERTASTDQIVSAMRAAGVEARVYPRSRLR
jgi:copper chaperone CopZ